MNDTVNQILEKSIQLADQVTKTVDDVSIPFKQEFGEIKSKTEKLSSLLRQVAAARVELYLSHPTRRIIEQTEQELSKSLSLAFKCRLDSIKKRIFLIVRKASFHKTSSRLKNSIGDVSWLLHISSPDEDHGSEYVILPPIAFNDPVIAIIWEKIASLCRGSPKDRSDAAAILVSLANQSDRYGKMIIAEGGVGPLLKLMKEGNTEGKENAARVIGILKVIDSVIILIINASMRTAELSAFGGITYFWM